MTWRYGSIVPRERAKGKTCVWWDCLERVKCRMPVYCRTSCLAGHSICLFYLFFISCIWFCVWVRWEYDESYCEAVKKMPPYDAGPRLLDVIDTSIFDYLIGNADRHHYESFQDDGGASMLILLDNAKRWREEQMFYLIKMYGTGNKCAFLVCSFGNPSLDERSILAPLYQCCMWVSKYVPFIIRTNECKKKKKSF